MGRKFACSFNSKKSHFSRGNGYPDCFVPSAPLRGARLFLHHISEARAATEAFFQTLTHPPQSKQCDEVRLWGEIRRF
jgi:hypothetical protein